MSSLAWSSGVIMPPRMVAAEDPMAPAFAAATMLAAVDSEEDFGLLLPELRSEFPPAVPLPAFAAAAVRGIMDAGSDALEIGMAGTEEMYWAVTEFGACAGIQVTASHNPINYNGMKFVKTG